MTMRENSDMLFWCFCWNDAMRSPEQRFDVFCSHHRWGGGGWVGGSQSLVPVGQKVVVVCYVDDNKKEKKQKILSHAQERKRRCVRISGVLGGGDGRRVVVSVKLTGNLNLAGPGLREVVVLCHYACGLYCLQ